MEGTKAYSCQFKGVGQAVFKDQVGGKDPEARPQGLPGLGGAK